jgi:hypothetical protein
MLSFSTWRAFYRIPLLRDNREAVRILRDMFYVLMALHRAERFKEFSRLRDIYFKMLESFVQYGRSSARDTLDEVLEIPWFRDNQRDMYRLIASFNNVIRNMHEASRRVTDKTLQERITRETFAFLHLYKSLAQYDARDERRVNHLLERKKQLDEMLEYIHRTLGY